MRIFITGATSLVAIKIIEVLYADGHKLTLVDSYKKGIKKIRNMFPASNILTGNAYDREFIKSSLKGHDAVIHMAIVHGANSPQIDQWRVNIEGTFVVASEAVEAGIKKFIFISSLSAIDACVGYPDVKEREEVKPKQKNFYGFSKYLGELITKFYAEHYNMPSVSLRLIAVVPENKNPEKWLKETNPKYWTSARDVAQAVKLALEKKLPSGYEIFHIAGNHPEYSWMNKKAKKILGYKPKDCYN